MYILFAEKNSSLLWARHELLAEKELRKRGSSSSNDLPDEISLFLSTPVASLDTNPIRLWLDMEPTYPKLFKIAIKYLTIMATSVPSERLFSKAGQIMTSRRNRLSGSRLHKQLFLGSISKPLW